VSPQEQAIITMVPDPPESFILLGRSGTGKTTCAVYKIWWGLGLGCQWCKIWGRLRAKHVQDLVGRTGGPAVVFGWGASRGCNSAPQLRWHVLDVLCMAALGESADALRRLRALGRRPDPNPQAAPSLAEHRSTAPMPLRLAFHLQQVAAPLPPLRPARAKWLGDAKMRHLVDGAEPGCNIVFITASATLKAQVAKAFRKLQVRATRPLVRA
jgi:hypothetical protein